MKTTLTIDDAILRELREEAARRGTTMSALVEAGLRRILSERPDKDETVEPPPLPTWNSGGALVDVADREALYEAIDYEHDMRMYGTRGEV